MERSVIKKQGFSLIEVMIAIAIFAIFSGGVLYLSMDVVDRDSKIELENEALSYAVEGIEAVRNMRDRNFDLLTNGDHGLEFASDSWSFVQAPETIDDYYERTVTIEDVYRDENGDIVASGTYDPETKKVTSEVAFNYKGVIPRTVILTTYVSNWPGDDWIETTCTEFNLGVFTDTEVVATDPPPVDDCAIKLSLEEEYSSFFASADVGDHGMDVDVDGNYAYMANNKMQTGFTIVSVADPANPSVIRNVDVGGKGRYVAYADNYAYVGVDKSNAGLAIINASNPASASKVSSLNIGGSGNAMAVSGNYLYMGASTYTNSFKVINISNKSNPSVTKSLNFGDEVKAVAIDGNYAYVGLGDDYNGFRVVDISNPANAAEVATLNLGEEVNTIRIDGLFAYVGTDNAEASFKVINISNPENPSVEASLDVEGEIEDLAVSGSYAYFARDEQNSGMGAVNISNPLDPYFVYNRDITGKGTGIDADENNVYVTIRTNNRGLVIIGTTVSGVVSTGEFVSEGFDTGSATTRYNFIEWDHTEVPTGSVKFQIRTADTLENLAGATWVGSDGTNATYYENPRTAITLDPSRTGNQFFQFKLIINSDGLTTPYLESVRINFVP